MKFLLFAILRPFFYLLYHPLAWTYDLVASTVSLGRWKSWVLSSLAYIEAGNVLELGHGPGHLQLALNFTVSQVFGLDKSRQMGRLAFRRLRNLDYHPRLTRGCAQSMPFPPDTFHTVVATFPSEYIFDPRSLNEIQRVLAPGGRLVVLAMAWITGRRATERFLAWLFRVTGETPGKPGQLQPVLRDRFAASQLEVRTEIIEIRSSTLLFLLARKPPSAWPGKSG